MRTSALALLLGFLCLVFTTTLSIVFWRELKASEDQIVLAPTSQVEASVPDRALLFHAGLEPFVKTRIRLPLLVDESRRIIVSDPQKRGSAWVLNPVKLEGRDGQWLLVEGRLESPAKTIRAILSTPLPGGPEFDVVVAPVAAGGQVDLSRYIITDAFLRKVAALSKTTVSDKLVLFQSLTADGSDQVLGALSGDLEHTASLRRASIVFTLMSLLLAVLLTVGASSPSFRGFSAGVSLVEFGLLVALIAVVCVASVTFFGKRVKCSLLDSATAIAAEDVDQTTLDELEACCEEGIIVSEGVVGCNGSGSESSASSAGSSSSSSQSSSESSGQWFG